MERLSIISSVLLTIWFLLFDQQIIIQTAGFIVESYDEITNDDLLVSTEMGIFSDDTTSIENSTEILSEIEQTESSDDDVIELNVSGQKITTLRSTLTAVPNSKLALMFTKNNTDIRQSKDKQGAVFFDYNPVQFNYLLDQLRMIKRTPEIPAYELDIRAPNADIRSNFSYMILDLGLNPSRFLTPSAGTHLNLSINSLIGWKECYRSPYDAPFDLLTFITTCTSRRLLIACHSADNKENLTLAGVGKWEDILRQCSSITSCVTAMKDGTRFYYVNGQAWGFEGRPTDLASIYHGNIYNYGSGSQDFFRTNPCDPNDQYSEYRLCWSLRSNIHRGGGDRCGSMKNLHNAANWERIIYQSV